MTNINLQRLYWFVCPTHIFYRIFTVFIFSFPIHKPCVLFLFIIKPEKVAKIPMSFIATDISILKLENSVVSLLIANCLYYVFVRLFLSETP